MNEALKKYKKKITRIYIDMYPTDKKILEHLQKQQSKARYIKELIKNDIKKEP